MHYAPRGRLHRRGLGADAASSRRRRRRPRPLRAAPVLRRERHGARPEGARGARRRPAADPLLRRDPRGARRRRHRAQDRPPDRARPRRVAERAPARGDRLRAHLGDRHRQDGDPRDGPGDGRLRPLARARALRAAADEVRVLYGGSVKAENIDELMAQPDIDGVLVGGAASTPSSRASCAAAARERACRARRGRGAVGPRALAAAAVRRAHRPRRLGLAPPGPGNAVELADTPVFDRLWATTRTRTLELGRRRPARRADGQLRGRAPEHRRGRGRLPGPHAHHQGHRRRRLLSQPGARAAFATARARST